MKTHEDLTEEFEEHKEAKQALLEQVEEAITYHQQALAELREARKLVGLPLLKMLPKHQPGQPSMAIGYACAIYPKELGRLRAVVEAFQGCKIVQWHSDIGYLNCANPWQFRLALTLAKQKGCPIVVPDECVREKSYVNQQGNRLTKPNLAKLASQAGVRLIGAGVPR